MKSFATFSIPSALALLELVAASCCGRNQCLKAIVSPALHGIADCSSNLAITITDAASTSFETVTVEETALATAIVIESRTTTTTETVLVTVETTVVASTFTDVVFETTSVPITENAIQTVATFTTTVYNYQSYQATARLRARQSAAPALPEYASAGCISWDKYVAACHCVGVNPKTVTIPAPIVTVTIPVSSSVALTLSSTATAIASVSTTTSSTRTDTVSKTDTVTAAVTNTISYTTTVSHQATATASVQVSCAATGITFRASNPFPDTTTRFMNAVNAMIVAWQTFPTNPSASSLVTSTWVLDSDGFLQLQQPISGSTEVLAAYVVSPGTKDSIQVQVAVKSAVEAGVGAGSRARVRGCMNEATGKLSLIAYGGRTNMLSCGNALYLSTGTGTDIRSDCVFLTPMVTYV